MLEEQVIQVLKSIYDPELPVNIYDLGLIYKIEIEEKNIKIKMTLTSPACPVAESFPQMVQDKLLGIAGVEQVGIELVWDPPWTKDILSDAVKLDLNLL